MKLNNILTRNVKKFGHLYFFGVIAVILVDILQLYVPQIIGEITDGLRDGSMDAGQLTGSVLEMLAIGLIVTIGRFIWRYFVFGTSRYVEREMRNEFFSKMLRLSQGFFNKNKTGDMMALATNDLGAVRMMAGPGIVMFIDTTLFTILVLYKMVTYVDVRLTLVAIIPMPLIAFSSLFLGRAIRRRFKDKQEAFAKMTEMVQENISGIRVIKAFVQESREMAAFDRINRNNYDQNMRVVRLQSLSQPIANFVVSLCIILVLAYGGAMVMSGQMTVGNLVAFVQYLFMLIWPMIALGMGINIMSQGMASLQRIEDVLEQPEEIHDGDCNLSITGLKGAIEINGLDFGYSEEASVLQGIHVEIEAGQSVGIIGRTGSGKTTLINLMTRLYNPPKGRIFVDGHELYEVPLNVLRTQIVGVPQDNFLFSETIEANIAFGDLEVERQSVEAAARAAAVHDNIIDFPQGYETVVGEKGVTLSGGQKQRVSIARALLLQPPVLILDDSLSAVDTNTEAEILDNLRTQRAGKTTIIIAHRISAIAHCDQILVMDGGRIVERGDHETLLGQQGLYSSLYNKQQLEKELEAMA